MKTLRPNGRRDQSQFHYDQGRIPKPDLEVGTVHAVGGIGRRYPVAAVQLDQHRPEERHHHQDHRQTFHEAAEDDQDGQHDDEDDPRGEPAGTGPIGQRGWQAGPLKKPFTTSAPNRIK